MLKITQPELADKRQISLLQQQKLHTTQLSHTSPPTNNEHISDEAKERLGIFLCLFNLKVLN